MKKKIIIFIYPLMTLVIVLFLANSCNKDVNSESSNIVKDIDGNIYHTVSIGTQVWLAENLKTTRYSNGDLIGTTFPAIADIMDEVTPKYQWTYDGNEVNEVIYGRLYTWYAVTDSRNICPQGWHIPSDAEWTTLIASLGGESNAQKNFKEKGFALQYGGWRTSNYFLELSEYELWWSVSEVNPNLEPGAIDQVYCWTMANNASIIARTYRYKKSGLSVLCIKDN